MRFIRGDSLKEAIERFHADGALRNDAGRSSLELRKLLRRFLDVCNAIDYAHSRGVLHRDIKPGNIIVGRHGETLVVDWGLAKALGRSEPDAGERTLIPTSASGSAETLPGSALGTPAYMSPEQARGDLEHLSPRSDVYCLGATLYCLLTGKPPVEGDDIGAVLRAVQNGMFPPPRQIDPTIERPLEAVCLQAMALRPEDRYATPKSLADDIERWMADEPVTAWREPFARRAQRWARRHRTAVTAASVAFLAVVVGLGAITAVQARANSDLRIANGEVRRVNTELAAEKARVQQRYDLAMYAIETFHTGVSEDFLLKEEKFRDLRDRLLKSAGDFYGKLGALLKNQSDRVSRRALGQANFELAELTSKVGRKEAALAAHRQVLAYREAWARERSPESEDRVDLGRSLVVIGRLLEETGRHAEALESLVRVRTLVDDSAEPVARSSLLRGVLATSVYWTGAALRKSGRLDEALKAYREVQAIRRELSQSDPDAIDTQRELSWCSNDMGLILGETGRPSEALEAYEESGRIKQALADAHPEVAEYQRDLAIAFNNIAIVLIDTGRPSEAMASHERALAILQKLVDAHPAVTEFQSDLARNYNNIGRLLLSTGRLAEALTAYEKALAIRQKLADANPTVIQFQSDLAQSHDDTGDPLLQTGRPAEALTAYEKALAIRQKLADANPTVIQFQSDLAWSYFWFGSLMLQTGQPALALAAQEKALAIRQKLAQAHPTVTSFRFNLAYSLARVGSLKQKAGRVTEAADLVDQFHQVVATLERLPTLLPDNLYDLACYHALLADAAEPRADVATAEGQTQAERAMHWLRRAVAAGYLNLPHMRTDTDLDPLRSRADFQLLMMDLTFPAEPFARRVDDGFRPVPAAP
jgi:serine/threonine-protein kinase